MPKLAGQVELMFIRGGVSAKTKRPYLQVSNGRAEFFVDVPKTIDTQLFEEKVSTMSEGDMFTCDVKVLVGANSVKLVSI